jgi:saccharopine dehydrogenase-like NADP-dependent oxidoreductase
MKNILLFGAGKSATVLIDYLKTIAQENQWNVTIADVNLDTITQKIGGHKNLTAVALDIENTPIRNSLIANADIVISLMPPHLHFLIAQDCLQLSKNMLTASYIDEATNALNNEAKNKGILFLYEMGLDPGIDHMSAMKLINEIKENGGKITSFISHCGGLVAPQSDDNCWHYKISWNPKNVVMAGKAGATFLEKLKQEKIEYNNLFDTSKLVAINDNEQLAFYANRDSLGYIKTYNLEGIETFIRTTLRHPEFIFGWKNIIDLKLTNEDKIYDTNGLSLANFYKQHFDKNGCNNWLDEMLMQKLNNAKETMEKLMQILEIEEETLQNGEAAQQQIMMVDQNGTLNTIEVNEVKDQAATYVADSMNEANLSVQQLVFLGLDDNETIINKGLCSACDVLQFALEQKLVLQPHDKDMIIMLHEIEFWQQNKKYKTTSLLKVIGNNSTHTAMAKTVGLPLGIAVKLILEGAIKETGLHIPIQPNIYNLVLEELAKHNIIFEEKTIEL